MGSVYRKNGKLFPVGLVCLLVGILCQLKICSAGTSPASKLLSGIWTEEGCIVPHDDKSRKIWGVATVWLLDDPVDPCNSPCGCPPEGLNPPLLVKPSNGNTGGIVNVPMLVQAVQIPASPSIKPTPTVKVPPTVNGIPPGCVIPGVRPLNVTSGVFPSPVHSGIRVPPVGPFLPQPLPFIVSPTIAPPFFGPILPLPPHFIGPPRPHFVGPFPPHPVPHFPTVPRPVVGPVIEKVPIDFGSFHAPSVTMPISAGVSVGTTSITQADHDKTQLNVNYNSDKGNSNTVTSTLGTVATGIPLIVTPPNVGISTGSTVIAQEDWDKEKLNANYAKDKGSKQTVTTSGGNVAVPGKVFIIPPQEASQGTTTVTQEDWNKEKFNANYNKDTGSKQTVTSTGGNFPVAGTLPCATNGVVGTTGTTTVTQEDWDKQHLNANYDKDKGSKQTVSTTGGTIGRPGQTIYIPSQVVTAPSTTITQEDWDKEKLNANYNKDKGSKHTVTSGAAFVAAPEPCMCTPGAHPMFAGILTGQSATSSTQEDWNKQNMNLQYDRDHGSKTNATSIGTNFGNAGGYLSHPSFYGPTRFPPAAPMVGPVQYQPHMQHVDLGLLLPPVPPPQGPFAVILPPMHHQPFVGFPPQVVSMPFVSDNQGVLPKPSYSSQHTTGSPLVNLGHSSVVFPHEGLSPRPLPVPSSHGISSILSKVPVIGPLLKPILEPVIIDFGDHPTSVSTPLYLPNVTQDLPSPPQLPLLPSANLTAYPQTSGRIPSFISKIPIVGPLLKPYLLPEPVAVNVGDIPVSTPSIEIPFQRPSEPLFHTVPIYYENAPLPQPFIPFPTNFFPHPVTGPMSPPLLPSSDPSILPAGIPHDTPQLKPSQVVTLPATIPHTFPTGNHLHTVPIDFGTRTPLQNLPPPPSIGPVYLPVPPQYDAKVVATQNVQDPGLTVSKYNRNILVNRYGGGVVLAGNSQSFKCRSSAGKCNLRRSLKHHGNSSSENYLRMPDDTLQVLKPVPVSSAAASVV